MTMTPAQQIVRLEYVVREQIKEIDRLRTENQALVDWIQGDSSHAYRRSTTARLHLRPIRSRPLPLR